MSLVLCLKKDTFLIKCLSKIMIIVRFTSAIFRVNLPLHRFILEIWNKNQNQSVNSVTRNSPHPSNSKFIWREKFAPNQPERKFHARCVWSTLTLGMKLYNTALWHTVSQWTRNSYPVKNASPNVVREDGLPQKRPYIFMYKRDIPIYQYLWITNVINAMYLMGV